MAAVSCEVGRFSVPTNTIQSVRRALSFAAGSALCNVGVPLDQDGRPYLSNSKPKEEDKVRADLKLWSQRDECGRECVLFSLDRSDVQSRFGLPISYAIAVGQPLIAQTVADQKARHYAAFEGAIQVDSGDFLMNAVTALSERETIDTTGNRVPRDFTVKILEIAADKLGS